MLLRNLPLNGNAKRSSASYDTVSGAKRQTRGGMRLREADAAIFWNCDNRLESFEAAGEVKGRHTVRTFEELPYEQIKGSKT
jgi:hypothetical protein